MKLELLQGQYSSNDIIDIVSKIIQVKINYHEQKISSCDNEEDIEQREKKIKGLQEKLQEIRLNLKNKNAIFSEGQFNFSI